MYCEKPNYCIHPPLVSPNHSTDALIRSYVTIGEFWREMREFYQQESLEIDKFRIKLVGSLPGRTSPCSRGMNRCCGVCTKICNDRCMYDIASRIQMYLLQSPDPDSAMYRTVVDTMNNRETTYLQFCGLINQMVSGYFNASKRKELRKNGIIENPNKLNYSPRLEYEINERTGKVSPKANRETGQVCVVEWPNSGLCPFCLPTNSARHKLKCSN